MRGFIIIDMGPVDIERDPLDNAVHAALRRVQCLLRLSARTPLSEWFEQENK